MSLLSLLSSCCGLGRGHLFLLLVFLPLCELVLILLPVDCLVGALDIAEDVVYVITPLNACIGHAVVDLRCLAQITIFSLLRDFHRTIEVLRSRVEVTLLGQDLA